MFYIQIFCEENTDFSIIIEDDGKVCYAYLLEGKNIIGDVWLYNNVATPKDLPWRNKEELPFLNPSAYVDDSILFDPLESDTEVKVSWVLKDGLIKSAKIALREAQFAVLEPGLKPGWSKLAKKDGPLAKRMV